ncbi:hypothetical protein [Ramlibacter albus]|uniref:Uncharacterized protein n=1 Tax=Ramlibacter albus TaxID=2079448 RepID=A0A923M5H0_9BURK|nr:hypothetical protein [Ramlibacter albus]MBC5764191.1 hypothetical protein [Ramlibacter albus]
MQPFSPNTAASVRRASAAHLAAALAPVSPEDNPGWSSLIGELDAALAQVDRDPNALDACLWAFPGRARELQQNDWSFQLADTLVARALHPTVLRSAAGHAILEVLRKNYNKMPSTSRDRLMAMLTSHTPRVPSSAVARALAVKLVKHHRGDAIDVFRHWAAASSATPEGHPDREGLAHMAVLGAMAVGDLHLPAADSSGPVQRATPSFVLARMRVGLPSERVCALVNAGNPLEDKRLRLATSVVRIAGPQDLQAACNVAFRVIEQGTPETRQATLADLPAALADACRGRSPWPRAAFDACGAVLMTPRLACTPEAAAFANLLTDHFDELAPRQRDALRELLARLAQYDLPPGTQAATTRLTRMLEPCSRVDECLAALAHPELGPAQPVVEELAESATFLSRAQKSRLLATLQRQAGTYLAHELQLEVARLVVRCFPQQEAGAFFGAEIPAGLAAAGQWFLAKRYAVDLPRGDAFNMAAYAIEEDACALRSELLQPRPVLETVRLCLDAVLRNECRMGATHHNVLDFAGSSHRVFADRLAELLAELPPQLRTLAARNARMTGALLAQEPALASGLHLVTANLAPGDAPVRIHVPERP